MVTDDRYTGTTTGAAFESQDASDFDFTAFYKDFTDACRIHLAKHEVTWFTTYATPERPVDVVLNLSCGAQTVPNLMLLWVRLFDALGIDYVATAGTKYCCGRNFQRLGREETGERLANHAMDRFASWDPATNVQTCGSCYIEFGYQARLREAERGEKPFEVLHLNDFLLRRLRELGDDVPWKKELPRRVLLHAEGAEVHPTKAEARDTAIATMGLIPGVEFVGMADAPSLGMPCASTKVGGPKMLAHITPEQYRQTQDELVAQAKAAGADTLTTQHFGCHKEWSKFGSDRLPILHYLSLVGEALGVTVPDRYQTLWRLGDLSQILERSRPQWESWGMAEERAREIVRKTYASGYASEVPRCPCEGDCDDVSRGSECETSWYDVFTGGEQLPVLELPGP